MTDETHETHETVEVSEPNPIPVREHTDAPRDELDDGMLEVPESGWVEAL